MPKEFKILKHDLTCKISKEELVQFSLLLNKGLDTTFMIEICFRCHKSILAKLNEGEKLVSILTNGKENYFQILRILKDRLPFKEAIHCANEIDDVGKGWIKELIKTSIYPAFLFLFSFGMILFFQEMILPAMSQLASKQAFLFLSILQFVFSLLLFLIFVFLIFFLIVYTQKKTEHLYAIFCRFALLRKVISLHFSLLMSTFLGYGLSTMECIEMLCKIHPKSLYHPLAIQIQKALHQGNTMIQALQLCHMDEEFVRFFTMGLHTSSTKELLHLYQQKVQKELEQKAKKLSLYIQIGSYTSVGIVVLTVYQILLVPMNVLNTL